MNKTVKKVLSYIGIALLGFASGVGCLIGVSSCSQKQDHTQVKQVNKKKSMFSKDTYFHFLDLPNNNSFTGSQVSSYFTWSVPANNTFYRYRVEGQVKLMNTNYVSQSVSYIDIGWRQSYSLWQVGYVSFKSGDFERLLWDRDNPTTFNDLYFMIDGSISLETPYITELYEGALMDMLTEDYHPLQNFTFSGFNPYDLWSTSQETPYVNFSSDIGYTRRVNVGLFECDGLLFNQIHLIYADASNVTFRVGNQDKNYNLNTGEYVYFNSMLYYNTIDETSLTVVRNEVIYGSGNNNFVVVAGGYKWVNDVYKSITLLQNDNPSVIAKLTSLSYQGYSSNIYSSDVGLGNVFSLVSLAFSSLIPILSISIIPGISIGLLVFLPLITGIIIAIIWVVKR